MFYWWAEGPWHTHGNDRNASDQGMPIGLAERATTADDSCLVG